MSRTGPYLRTMVQRLRSLFERLPWWVRNIYFATVVIFVVWMLAFDRYNVFRQWSLSREVRQMERQKDFYRAQIDAVEHDYDELFSTDARKEKFARERYLMKRADEDIFVIIEE